MTTIPSQSVSGYLGLRFLYDGQRQQTSLAAYEQVPPLRIIHAFPLAGGATMLHLHNISGGVLGGDRLALDVEVGPQARVQLTTTSATRLYRRKPALPAAHQECVVHVRVGGLLEYVPDQLIPFAGACYEQVTRIELEEDAGLFWWEIIAPGRLARGESFAYERLQLEMLVTACGLPIACERFRLEPAQAPLLSLARLGTYAYHTSFLICRTGLPATRWTILEQELTTLMQNLTRPGEVLWGVSTLAAHGLLVRGLSCRSQAIVPGLLACWQAAKQALYGMDAVLPRKIY